MRLRFLLTVIPAVLAWPSVLGQVPVKNPLHKPLGRPGAAYMLSFDPSTVERVEGRVVRVHQVPSPNVWLTGVQLQVRTTKGDVAVLLGPAWFIDNQELHFAVGDEVSVTGSHIRPNGVDSLIAMEVRRGAELLTLRGGDGMPVWVAWRWQAAEAARARP